MKRILLAALLLAGCAADAGRDGSEAADYADEYGGALASYRRILALTDCDELQAEFETAAANNDTAEPGSDRHRNSLGFMTAAEDRRQDLGC